MRKRNNEKTLRLPRARAKFETTNVGGEASARTPSNDAVATADFARARTELENLVENAIRMERDLDRTRGKIQRTKRAIESFRRRIDREIQARAAIRASLDAVERVRRAARERARDEFVANSRAAPCVTPSDCTLRVHARVMRDYETKLREIDAMTARAVS